MADKQGIYTVLDLFSGIGGFSLGLERTGGFKTVAFCEIEERPRAELNKHWPAVPIFEDIRKLHAKDITKPIDLICGGYPCQPFSVAGQRRGTEDDRHLWPEVIRLIRELSTTTGKPTWCIFENVAGHVSMGLDQVLSDLEGEGYACWPFIIPACALNANHRRDRVWIIANSRLQRQAERQEQAVGADQLRTERATADTDAKHGDISGLRASQIPQQQTARLQENSTTDTAQQSKRKQTDKANSESNDRETWYEPCHNSQFLTDPKSEQAGGIFESWFSTHPESGGDWRGKADEWTTEPPVCGPDDGIPDRVARLKALGNAVVPQIPELLGLIILSS